MKRLWLLSLTAALLLTSGPFASPAPHATPGIFLGEVVNPPHGEKSVGLLYLLGRDGNVRRVVIARAVVEYTATMPDGDRVKPVQNALVPGAEVRVTALVDAKSGEWTATRVEVIANEKEIDDGQVEDDPATGEITIEKEIAIAYRTI